MKRCTSILQRNIILDQLNTEFRSIKKSTIDTTFINGYKIHIPNNDLLFLEWTLSLFDINVIQTFFFGHVHK